MEALNIYTELEASVQISVPRNEATVAFLYEDKVHSFILTLKDFEKLALEGNRKVKVVNS